MALKKARSTSAITLLGCLSVFASAFCFYISTVIINLSHAYTVIDPSIFVFARFVMGFLIVLLVLLFTKARIKPKRYDLLIARTVFNCLAVFFFYKAVVVTTVVEANILNMLYPVFVAILSWFFLKKQHDYISLVMVAVAFAGVWLVLSPSKIGFNTNSLWGLGSGISAAFAIISLNVSRQYHDSNTILFFMFGTGAVMIFAIFHQRFYMPDLKAFYYILWCGGFGVAGQYLLTIGFRYVTAVEGGIISSTRILLAAILGPIIVSDDPLTFSGWVGALLIFITNVILAVRKNRSSEKEVF